MSTCMMRILLLLNLAFMSSVIHASNNTNVDCNVGTVSDSAECYARDNKRLSKQMDTAFNHLKTMKLDNGSGISRSEYVAAFTESQTAWNKYVKINCGMITLPYSSSQGSGMGLAIQSCQNDAYQSRVNELQAWLEDIQAQ